MASSSAAAYGNASSVLLPTHIATTSKPAPPPPRNRRACLLCLLVTLVINPRRDDPNPLPDRLPRARPDHAPRLHAPHRRRPARHLRPDAHPPAQRHPAPHRVGAQPERGVLRVPVGRAHRPDHVPRGARRSGPRRSTRAASRAAATGEVTLALTVLADRLLAAGAAVAARLVADVETRGAVPLEAATRIPGRVSVLGGLFKRRAVAYSDCTFVFGVADMKVRSQQCHDRTKLS